MIGAQLNIGESRHSLARRVFFGNLGRLMRGYERGMEDQLGALGLGLNAITWWNSLYIDAAVTQLEAGGLGISPGIRARLCPLGSSTSTSTASTHSTVPTWTAACGISAILTPPTKRSDCGRGTPGPGTMGGPPNWSRR